MFTHHCSSCDKTQLIFLSQMTGVSASDEGAVATFTCWCGAEQTSDFSLFDAAPAPLSPALDVTV